MGVQGLGSFVQERRKQAGISQRELAKRVGISSGYMSHIETGHRKWPAKYVPALARELSVSEVEMAIAAGLISDPSVEARAA